MKPFPLETLLKVRRRRLQIAELELAQKNSAVSALQLERKGRLLERECEKKRLRTYQKSGDLSLAQAQCLYLDSLEKILDGLEKCIAEEERELSLLKEKISLFLAEKKIVEKLKEGHNSRSHATDVY